MVTFCSGRLACDGGLTADLEVGSDRVHIRYLGNGCYGFRPYGGSLLEKSPKSNQKGSCPNTRHLAHARCARNPTGIWGAAATRHPWRGAAKPASLPVYPPNPCRIPASVFDGAPEIKSKNKSGSLRRVDTRFWSGLAREGGQSADCNLTVTPRSKCGSWLACEGGLTADLDVGSYRVHIRYLGKGCYGFRPYGGSLWKRAPK